MAPTVTPLAACGRCPRSTTRCPYPVCPNLSLKASASSGKRVPRYLFIDMYRLCVLAEVVETGEAASAMALEGSFTSVFPVTLADTHHPISSPGLTLCALRDARCV